MAFQIEFSVEGEKLIARKLDRMGDRALDARPAFLSIADDMRGYEKRLFNTQGASSGTPWKPIKAETLARKAQEGLDPRVMHATHRLRDSLINRTDPEHFELATPDSLTFGTLVPYARYHQKAWAPRTRRKVMTFNVAQRRRILKRLETYIFAGRDAIV
jgi:hypothetical protein